MTLTDDVLDECCPWRSNDDSIGTEYKQFLTKHEAAQLVIDERILSRKKAECKLGCDCGSYDPAVYEVLKLRGYPVPKNEFQWLTAEQLNASLAAEKDIKNGATSTTNGGGTKQKLTASRLHR